MIINRSGIAIRTGVEQIRLAGRATQGVKIINLREGDSIASVVVVPKSEEDEPTEEAVVVEGAPQTEEAPAVAEVATEVTPEEN